MTGSVRSAFSISVDNAAQAQDLTSALSDVKSHYEALAQRSKQDALVSVQDSVCTLQRPTVSSLHFVNQSIGPSTLYCINIIIISSLSGLI
jgi:basic type II keratin